MGEPEVAYRTCGTGKERWGDGYGERTGRGGGNRLRNCIQCMHMDNIKCMRSCYSIIMLIELDVLIHDIF